MGDALLTQIIAESVERAPHEDPAQGEWCINGEEMNVWIDASSLALEVLLEDVCWLRPANDAQHINLTESDALVKSVNQILQWQAKRLHIRTDSFCVYHWVSDTLTGKAKIRTKVASEMLIKRRLDTLKSLVSEYDLTVTVTRVALYCNLCLPVDTSVPQMPWRWVPSPVVKLARPQRARWASTR